MLGQISCEKISRKLVKFCASKNRDCSALLEDSAMRRVCHNCDWELEEYEGGESAIEETRKINNKKEIPKASSRRSKTEKLIIGY
jgi:hypothetical protein